MKIGRWQTHGYGSRASNLRGSGAFSSSRHESPTPKQKLAKHMQVAHQGNIDRQCNACKELSLKAANGDSATRSRAISGVQLSGT